MKEKAKNRESDAELSEAKKGLSALHKLFPSMVIQTVDGDASHNNCSESNRALDRQSWTFAERFEIVRKLGSGGFAIVLLARDRKLNRDVALKVYNANVVACERLQDRFLAEVQAMADFRHPGIVTIYDAGTEGALWYLVMEYCEGPTLSTWLQSSQCVTAQVAAFIVAQVANAVAYAHARGRLHRDLKPSNVLLASPLRPDDDLKSVVTKLADFGLTQEIDPLTHGSQADYIAGTLRYMSPEQALGDAEQVTTRSDVYSLGALLYELLSSRAPFADDSDSQWWLATSARNSRRPRCLPFEVPRDLAAICEKCLEVAPDRRYESAEALETDLQRYMRGEEVSARPIGRLRAYMRLCRKRPLVASLVLALTLSSMVGSLSVVWQWRRAEEEASLAIRNEAIAKRHLTEADELLGTLSWANDESQFWNDPTFIQTTDVRADIQRAIDVYVTRHVEKRESTVLTAISLRRAGHVLVEQGNLGEGIAAQEKGIAELVRAAKNAPQNNRISRQLAVSLYFHWLACVRNNRSVPESIAFATSNIENVNLVHNASVRQAFHEFAKLLIARGDGLERIQPGGGLQAYLPAVSLLEWLKAHEMPSADTRQIIADLYEVLGNSYLATSEFEASDKAYQSAWHEYLSLRERALATYGLESRLARCCRRRAELKAAVGDHVGAREILMQGYLELVPGDDIRSQAEQVLAQATILSLAVAESKGSPDNIERQRNDWLRCRTLLWHRRLAGHLDQSGISQLADVLTKLATYHAISGYADAAKLTLGEAIECHIALGSLTSGDHGAASRLLDCQWQLASLNEESGHIEDAQHAFTQLIAMGREAMSHHENDIAIKWRLEQSQARLASLMGERND